MQHGLNREGKQSCFTGEVDEDMDMESCKQHGLSRKSKQKLFRGRWMETITAGKDEGEESPW